MMEAVPLTCFRLSAKMMGETVEDEKTEEKEKKRLVNWEDRIGGSNYSSS